VPEVIPELVYVIGLFFAVVGYLTARGLLATWTHSLGYVFQWLAVHLALRIPTPFGSVHVDLGGPFKAIDTWAVTALQNWCAGAEIEMGYCLHGMEKVARYMSEAIDLLARETSQTFDALLHIHLPKWAKIAALAAVPPALLAKLIGQAIAHLRPEILRTVKVVEHAVPATVSRVVKYVHDGAIALPGWVIHLPRRLHGIDELNERLEKRLRKVETFAAAGVFAGILANLWGVSSKCVRSGGPIGKVARSLCGIEKSLLDDLLGLVADFFVLENICKVIPWLSTAASDIATPLVEALTPIAAGLCDPESSVAERLDVPQLYLSPPAESLTAGV